MPTITFGNMGRLVLKMNAMAAKVTVLSRNEKQSHYLGKFLLVSGPQYQFSQIFNDFLNKKSLLQTCPPHQRKKTTNQNPKNTTQEQQQILMH